MNSCVSVLLIRLSILSIRKTKQVASVAAKQTNITTSEGRGKDNDSILGLKLLSLVNNLLLSKKIRIIETKIPFNSSEDKCVWKRSGMIPVKVICGRANVQPASISSARPET